MTLPDHLHSKLFCHYFSITGHSARPEHLVFVDVAEAEMVKFVKDDNKVFLAVHKNFSERLAKRRSRSADRLVGRFPGMKACFQPLGESCR